MRVVVMFLAADCFLLSHLNAGEFINNLLIDSLRFRIALTCISPRGMFMRREGLGEYTCEKAARWTQAMGVKIRIGDKKPRRRNDKQDPCDEH